MNSLNTSAKDINEKSKQAAQALQSSHTNPIVENYIKSRNKKAEKQIIHEIYENLHHHKF